MDVSTAWGSTAAPYLLQEIADGFDRLLTGTADLGQSADCLGDAVAEAVLARFSILVAPTVAEQHRR